MDGKILKAALLIALGEWPLGNKKTKPIKPPVKLTPEELSEAITAAAMLSCPSCGE